MTTLITGGCGAIGSVVVNVLKKRYPERTFVVLDALTYAGNKDHIEPPFDNFKFYHGNICDASFVAYVLETEQPEYILHLAAETHVDQSFGNSFKFTETNVFGTHTLLECVRKCSSVKCFLHMSTDEVYGSVQDGETCSESCIFAPSNPYSATKAAAEMLCHAYWKSFGLPIVVVRCNNAISRYQHEEKLIPKVIECLRTGKKIPVHGKGLAKRTFIHANDITDALDIILHSGCHGGQVFNIGSDTEYSVLEVIEHIVNKVKAPKEFILDEWVEFVSDRAFQDYRYCVDSSALRKLGWKEKMSFDDALTDLLGDSVANRIV